MGLIPHWAADPSIGNRMINARAETLTELRSQRSPIVLDTKCVAVSPLRASLVTSGFAGTWTAT